MHMHAAPMEIETCLKCKWGLPLEDHGALGLQENLLAERAKSLCLHFPKWATLIDAKPVF